MELSDNILKKFNNCLVKISNFDLSYKISKFLINNDLDLLDYKHKKKNFIYFIDKSWVETHLWIYKAQDKSDNSNWIIVELIIWESKRKDIMFFSEWKIYNIIENKWWKIIKSWIIEDEKNILNILEFLNWEINYINNKINQYQNKLRIKGVLSRDIREEKIKNFKEIILKSVLV